MSRSIEHLTEICGPSADVFTDAAQDVKIAPKKKPTLEAVLTAIVKAVERRAVAGAAALIRDDLEECYEMHVLMRGDHEAAAAQGDDPLEAWETALDEAVETLISPYKDVLSNDWLGRETIDTRLWEEGALDTFATSFGKEVFKQLCWQDGKPEEGGGKPKTPAKILASAGITTSAVLGQFGDRISKAEGGNRDDGSAATAAQPQAEPTELDTVLDTIFERVGADFDIEGIQEELTLVFDDDDLLAKGAAQRLGIEDEGDINTLQLLGLNEGDGAAKAVIDGLLARKTGAAAAPAAPKRGAGRKPAAETPAGDPIPTEVLALLAAHGGTPNAQMAEKVGVSRATYANYATGKTQLVPTDDQRAALRSEVVAHVNGLLQALAQIDGAEPMAVQ